MKASKQSSTNETIESLEEFPTREFDANIYGLEIGITDHARKFLHRCAVFLEMGAAPPFPYAAFLAARLFELASLESPWDAALLKRGIGQKGADQMMRDFEVAQEVVEARKHCKSYDKAAEMVAENREEQARRGRNVTIVSAETAKYLYKKFRGVINRQPLASGSRLAKFGAAALKPLPLPPELKEMMWQDRGAGTTDASERQSSKRK